MSIDAKNRQRIECALIDPKAPWYGSDLIEWVMDFLQQVDAELAEKRARAKSAEDLQAAQAEHCDRLREKIDEMGEEAVNLARQVAKERRGRWESEADLKALRGFVGECRMSWEESLKAEEEAGDPCWGKEARWLLNERLPSLPPEGTADEQESDNAGG